MKSYRVATLPGDGIGPEVMDVTLLVLERIVSDCGLSIEFVKHEAGATHYRKTGEVLPASVLQDCLDADAVLLAAIGLPDVRVADGTEVQPVMMVGLRRALGLYAAVRPIKYYRGTPIPLRDVGPGIDFVILRENLEGLFSSFGGGCLVGDEVATDSLIVTRTGTQRIAEFAFRLARKRKGRPADGQRTVTCVDKANIFRSLAFFRKVFLEVAQSHANIKSETAYVDAMSLYMVRDPWNLDVLVMENQFGDILSDLGAGIVGGLGMAPSAEIGDKHALFQPSHGTAPDIAGKNVANPFAMLLSAAMMLDWLGEKHQDKVATEAGHRLETAVAQVIATGTTFTPDLGGKATTQDVCEAVIRCADCV